MHTRETDEKKLIEFNKASAALPREIHEATERLARGLENGLQNYSVSSECFKWPDKSPPREILFVYQHNKEGYLVYNTEDATKLQYKLQDKGYKHVSTLHAAIWMELLLNKASGEAQQELIQDAKATLSEC